MLIIGLGLTGVGILIAARMTSFEGFGTINNFIVLPLYFISGIFVPQDQIPDWMNTVAGIFPIRPLFQSLLTAFDPQTTGAGIEWGHLAVILAWGVAGLVVAIRGFRWVPREG